MSGEEGKGGLERRVAERIDVKLGVTWAHLAKDESDKMMVSGDYTDVFSIHDLHETVDEAAMERKAYTENLSVSGVRLVGDLRLSTGEVMQEGWELLVSLDIPNSPMPVRALALVVWVAPGENGLMSTGLFFKGINKSDVEKVTKLLILHKRAQHG
jgi:hypothetical protein